MNIIIYSYDIQPAPSSRRYVTAALRCCVFVASDRSSADIGPTQPAESAADASDLMPPPGQMTLYESIFGPPRRAAANIDLSHLAWGSEVDETTQVSNHCK
jgi:hypothetical protein